MRSFFRQRPLKGVVSFWHGQWKMCFYCAIPIWRTVFFMTDLPKKSKPRSIRALLMLTMPTIGEVSLNHAHCRPVQILTPPTIGEVSLNHAHYKVMLILTPPIVGSVSLNHDWAITHRRKTCLIRALIILSTPTIVEVCLNHAHCRALILAPPTISEVSLNHAHYRALLI